MGVDEDFSDNAVMDDADFDDAAVDNAGWQDAAPLGEEVIVWCNCCVFVVSRPACGAGYVLVAKITSPKAGNVIKVNVCISRKQAQTFGQCRGNQNAVKRITMQEWKSFQCFDVASLDGEQFDSVSIGGTKKFRYVSFYTERH